MPLVATKITVSGGYFLLWALEESLETLQSMVPATLDCAELETITHPQKKREWLVSRIVLVRLCESAGLSYTGIRKDTNGKPFLIAASAEISVSHSLHFVAAALSFSGPVGIDLERPSGKMQRIASKYLTDSEVSAIGDSLRLLCMYWCAKEAVFKCNGKAGVSFKHHISVAPFSEGATYACASLHTGDTRQAMEIRFYWQGEYCLAIAREAKAAGPCP